MIGVIMNPGTGPVAGRCLASNARKNIRAFRRDLDLDGVRIVPMPAGRPEDGRYSFRLERGKAKVVVEMPGCPLDGVRVGRGQWTFLPPRLYVDGSSWAWPFALNDAERSLAPENYDENGLRHA